MNGVVSKTLDNGKIINKTIYLCVGLKQNGLKKVLGMWGGKSESSSFLMGVLTDLFGHLKREGVNVSNETIYITIHKDGSGD